MFCPNCGNQMSDNAIFCSNCGYAKDGSLKKTNSLNLNKIPFVPIISIVFIIVLFMMGFNAFSNRTCKYCDNKVYKQGLCRDHYTVDTVKNNVNDFASGNKSFKDAAKDVYDKSFNKKEKKQIEDSVNDIKNQIGSFFK